MLGNPEIKHLPCPLALLHTLRKRKAKLYLIITQSIRSPRTYELVNSLKETGVFVSTTWKGSIVKVELSISMARQNAGFSLGINAIDGADVLCSSRFTELSAS